MVVGGLVAGDVVEGASELLVWSSDCAVEVCCLVLGSFNAWDVNLA